MKHFAATWLGIACFALSFPAGSAEPRILWEWNAENSSIPVGAELIRQPGEKPFLRVRGPEAPAFPIDGALLKGKMVTVEGVVRGEKLGQEFGDCLKLVPNYRPFDKYRENWFTLAQPIN